LSSENNTHDQTHRCNPKWKLLFHRTILQSPTS
jgi:hypothetical protein